MMPAITALPVPSVMEGSTGSLLLRSVETAVRSELSVPLVAMVSAATAEKPKGDTSANTACWPLVNAPMPSATTSLDQFGIQPLTKRPGRDGLGRAARGQTDSPGGDHGQQRRGRAEQPCPGTHRLDASSEGPSSVRGSLAVRRPPARVCAGVATHQ